MPVATESWKNCMDSERLKTFKTDYLVTDYEGKEVYQLGLKVCQPWKYRVECQLKEQHERWVGVKTGFCPQFSHII